jgi:hep_Hag family protein
MGTGTTLDDANKKVNSIAIGVNTQATKNWATAIGAGAIASGVSASQALGYDAVASGKSAIAQGYHSHADGQSSIAIGDNAKASGIATVSVGYMANGHSVDIDKNNTPSSTKATYGVAVGHFAGADYVGKDNQRSTAVGNQAGRYGEGGIRNTAVGELSGMYVKGSNNVAMGAGAGSGTNAEKLEASETIAIGHNAKGSAAYSTAIGSEAKAKGIDSIAMGLGATVEEGFDGIAIGTRAKAKEKGMAVGAYSQANGAESGVFANAIGSKGSTASGRRASIIGVESTVSGNNSVAIGDTNTVASARTYAIGNNINVAAGANDSLVFGTKAAVGGAEAIALGKTANSKTEGAISIGAYAVSGDGDPVSGVEELGKKSISIGYQSVANRYDTIAMGVLASTQAADSAVAPWDAVAIGSKSKATTYKALAIGAYSQATGRQSTVIGNDIQGQNSTASGTRSQILGVQSNVSGDNSVSIGDTNTIASARTYALGNNINVKAGADDSLAFGTRAAVGAVNTVAIGANANAAQANSVALGAGSTTDNIHEGDYTLNDSYTAAGLPNAANGAVSVGSAGKERQIQNVAAGVISETSTDAINGSQLYATNNYINNFAGDVKTKLGGNAALGKDGHLTMTNIGGTGKDNVNDAIAAANTKVEAGDNITVTPITNSDGSKTYTVATKKDLVVDSVKAGDTTVNADGVTIAGGPSITKSGGINANGRKVTGVLNGDINPTSTDAVNGSQLHATNTKLDNVANALADTHFVVDTKATTGGELDDTSQADQKIKSGNKVTLQAGKNLKAKQTNGTDGAQVEFSLKDSISLTQVTAGTGANQVVLGNDGVKVGDSTLNTDGLTIAGGPSVKKDGINAGDKKITGVADGNVAAGSKDAVNGGQLAEVKAKADSAVQNVVSANPTALTVTKAGDTMTLTPNFIAGDLVNPATGEVNTPAADDAGKLVTAGTVAKALAETHFVVDTKATTGGELDGASQANQKIKSSNKVTLQAGKNLKAKQTNGTDGAQVEFSLKDSISLTQVTAGTGDNQVVLGKDGVQVGGNTYINKDGINAAGKAISNVANGNVAAYSKDAVNGGQLHDTAKSLADVIGGGATVKDGKVVAGQNGIGNTGQNTVHGAIAAINQNTANNFNQIRGDLRKMDRDLRGSIAGTLATAGLPQAFSPGKSMVAAAAGTYRGQSGLAIGVSRISDNGKVILKVTGNTNSRGDFGGTIGAGYQW